MPVASAFVVKNLRNLRLFAFWDTVQPVYCECSKTIGISLVVFA